MGVGLLSVTSGLTAAAPVGHLCSRCRLCLVKRSETQRSLHLHLHGNALFNFACMRTFLSHDTPLQSKYYLHAH